MNPKLPLDGRIYMLTVGSVLTTNVSQISLCQLLFSNQPTLILQLKFKGTGGLKTTQVSCLLDSLLQNHSSTHHRMKFVSFYSRVIRTSKPYYNILAIPTSVKHTTHSRSPHNALHSPSYVIYGGLRMSSSMILVVEN